jgi:hypothetical protein
MLGRKPGFIQRAEALRRDFHPRLGLGQATDVSDDRKVEAIRQLDAMLGRSLLDSVPSTIAGSRWPTSAAITRLA